MNVLCHHIYEYKKGIRKLILHTLNVDKQEEAEDKLKSNGISYLIREVSDKKINIFFGAPECISVIEQFGDKPLNRFTPEEDFILGTLLGYDNIQQCTRYIDKVKQASKIVTYNS